jgi:hypothetical protein
LLNIGGSTTGNVYKEKSYEDFSISRTRRRTLYQYPHEYLSKRWM